MIDPQDKQLILARGQDSKANLKKKKKSLDQSLCNHTSPLPGGILDHSICDSTHKNPPTLFYLS